MIRLQNTWRCDDQFILRQINDSLPAAGFVRSSRAERSRTENIRWLLYRDVLQLSYMLMNLYERLNQKCLSSRFWQNIWCPVWSLRHQGTKRIQTMLLSSLIMVSPSLLYIHRLQQVNFIRREQSDDEFVHEIWKMKMILVHHFLWLLTSSYITKTNSNSWHHHSFLQVVTKHAALSKYTKYISTNSSHLLWISFVSTYIISQHAPAPTASPCPSLMEVKG